MSVTVSAADYVDDKSNRIAQLEKSILELEIRLEKAEKDTRELRVLTSNLTTTTHGKIETGIMTGSKSLIGNQAAFDILAGSAWRNLRWTQEQQWHGIRPGITESEVVERLGEAPRSIKSLKPRVDKVLYYETNMGDRSSALRGKISLREGIVVSVLKPEF